MKPVAKERGLVLRGSSYHLRVVVPKDARPGFAPIWDRENPDRKKRRKGVVLEQVWIALNESDLRKANAKARLRKAALDGLFEEARNVGTPAAVPTAINASPSLATIQRAVQTYFYELERKQTPVPLDHETREEAVEVAITRHMDATDIDIHHRILQPVAIRVAVEGGIRLDLSKPSPIALLELVKAADEEHAVREVERLSLRPFGPHHSFFTGITANKPPRKTKTLAEAIAAYTAERGNRADKTKAMWKTRFGAWEALLGPDRVVAEISRDELKAARDVLMSLPTNATKRWPGKSLREIAKYAQEHDIEPMAPKTVGLYVECISSLMNQLFAEGELQTNPATRLTIPSLSDDDEDEKRRPLTPNELQQLFHSGPYAKPDGERGWRFWVPLIALFTGMRQGEVVGLMTADVCIKDDVHVLMVRRNIVRRLKTRQSTRFVPVHSQLIDLGFLDWASKQPADGMLFTDLPGDAKNPLNAAQKTLGRWVRSVFPDDDKVVFHSLRHTWKDTALNAAGVSDAMIERLGGWKAPGRSAMHGYGRGYSSTNMRNAIEKISFSEVDLSHLKAPGCQSA